ncbi:MAG: dTMP kinase [Candidatus Diapherotrites archaeon]
MNGFFLVFDGLDGCGKSTQLKLAKKFLIEQGFSAKQILLTKEPTNGVFGRKAKALQRKDSDPKSNALKCLEFYVKDRCEHLRKKIIPALRSGKIVLCDRFKYSTLAYQSVQGIPSKKIISMHKGTRSPDLVLIFDLPASVALKRITSSRKSRLQKFEQKKFLEKVRKKFREMKKFFPRENIQLINASDSIAHTFAKVKSRLTQLI